MASINAQSQAQSAHPTLKDIQKLQSNTFVAKTLIGTNL